MMEVRAVSRFVREAGADTGAERSRGTIGMGIVR